MLVGFATADMEAPFNGTCGCYHFALITKVFSVGTASTLKKNPKQIQIVEDNRPAIHRFRVS
jgi:hypothetical protein